MLIVSGGSWNVTMGSVYISINVGTQNRPRLAPRSEAAAPRRIDDKRRRSEGQLRC